MADPIGGKKRETPTRLPFRQPVPAPVFTRVPTSPPEEGFILPTFDTDPSRSRQQGAQFFGDSPSTRPGFQFGRDRGFGPLLEGLNRNLFQPLQLAADPFLEVGGSLIDVGVDELKTTLFGEGGGLGIAPEDRAQENEEQVERSRQTLADVAGFLTGKGDLSAPDLAGELRGRAQQRDILSQVVLGVAIDPAAGIAAAAPVVKTIRSIARSLKVTESTRIPTPAAQNIFDLQAITPGVNTRQMVSNAFKQSLAGKAINANMVLDNPMAVAANAERLRVAPKVDSVAGAFSTRFGAQASAVFDVDDVGRIVGDLANIDPSLPGNPTIQDIAARLPLYRDSLSPEQLKFFEDIREGLRPIQQLMEEVGIEVGLRADIIDGGFYIPRGNALEEGVDLPFKLPSGRSGGGKTGAERAAVFDSMAEGIDDGFQYSSIEEVLNGFVSNIGRRVDDQHIVNFWKNAVDPITGQKVGQTLANRIPQGLKTQVQTLRNKIRSRRVTLQNQTVRVTEQVNTATRAERTAVRATIDSSREGP